MIYFISGHRDLTKEEFEQHYIPQISKVMDEDSMANFVVGDWEGCDTMALEFILSQPSYDFISIHCVDKPKIRIFGECPEVFERVFIYKCKSYDECDATMTKNSDFDIAWIRPGKENSHTAKNIKRRYGFNN